MRGLLVSVLALGAFLLIIYLVFGGPLVRIGSSRTNTANMAGIVAGPR